MTPATGAPASEVADARVLLLWGPQDPLGSHRVTGDSDYSKALDNAGLVPTVGTAITDGSGRYVIDVRPTRAMLAAAPKNGGYLNFQVVVEARDGHGFAAMDLPRKLGSTGWVHSDKAGQSPTSVVHTRLHTVASVDHAAIPAKVNPQDCGF